MRAVIQHGRNRTAYFSQNFVFHNHKSYACRRQIFLCASVNKPVFAHIHRTGENIGRHICNQSYRRINVVMDFGSENRIVGSNVKIIGVGRDGIIFGDICKIVGFGRGNLYNFAKQPGFFQCLACPCACIQVSGFFFQQIAGRHAKLQTCPAAQKQYGITFRNI